MPSPIKTPLVGLAPSLVEEYQGAQGHLKPLHSHAEVASGDRSLDIPGPELDPRMLWLSGQRPGAPGLKSVGFLLSFTLLPLPGALPHTAHHAGIHPFTPHFLTHPRADILHSHSFTLTHIHTHTLFTHIHTITHYPCTDRLLDVHIHTQTPKGPGVHTGRLAGTLILFLMGPMSSDFGEERGGTVTLNSACAPGTVGAGRGCCDLL